MDNFIDYFEIASKHIARRLRKGVTSCCVFWLFLVFLVYFFFHYFVELKVAEGRLCLSCTFFNKALDILITK